MNRTDEDKPPPQHRCGGTWGGFQADNLSGILMGLRAPASAVTIIPVYDLISNLTR